MKLPTDSRRILHWLATALAVALTTILLYWMGANSTTAGMVFLVLVVWFSAQTGVGLSLCATLLCAVCFDYFFLPPFRSLQIVGVQQWVAMISFLLSCAVVSRLAKRARAEARQAVERREDVERLYTLAQEMMIQEDSASLLHELPRLVGRIFALDEVALYVLDQDQLYTSGAEPPESIRASLHSLTQGQNPMQAIPGGYWGMTLVLGLRPVGALAWRSAELSHEVAAAVGAQVAIALTRATAMEASARMEASREGERLRTALVDSLTHELRTPLTAIRAAASTLVQGEGLDDALRQDLAAIVDEESARLDRLIGEAVEMAEIDANVVQIHRTSQHPRALLEQAVEESRTALTGRRVLIAVEEPCSSKNPVWFDPRLLGRVMRHLLENAARYTPPGGRILLRSRRAGERLEFAVEDDGPGIDAQDLPLIFEKFYQGKKSATRGKGSGMGLAIARAILIAHGGGIEASNAPGQGACLRFWVPLLEKEPARGTSLNPKSGS